MTTWDLRRLQQFLDKHKPGSLYLVYGEETYLVDESLALLRAKVLTDGAVDFNCDVFQAGETSATQLLDSVQLLPMMCERRLVICKGIDSYKEADWDILEPLLTSPVDSTCLVLVAAKVDKRKKHVRHIFENGVVLELNRPFDNQVPTWIDYIAYQNDLKLSRESVAIIHQLVGANLGEINNEMKKLKQFVGDRAEADVKDVLAVVSQSRVETIFHLTEAIGRGDRAEALTCLANLLGHGESEVGTLAMIYRHVRILASVREGIRDGLTGQRLSAQAGVPQFFLKQYMEQCRSWSEDKIVHTIRALHNTDRALKSSPVSAPIWLENFIIETCG